MLWTDLDEDTLGQCRHAIQNCEHYSASPAPWFPLLLRMHEELAQAGMLERVRVKQEICEGCVSYENGGCKYHFANAHVDQSTGKVLFCPGKTTPEMRAKQLAAHKKRGRA